MASPLLLALYQLRDRDDLSDAFRLVTYDEETIALSTAITHNWGETAWNAGATPVDKNMVLQTVGMSMNPGATQWITFFEFGVAWSDASGVTIGQFPIVRNNTVWPADANVSMDLQPDIIVPPNSYLYFLAQFNAAVNNNTIDSHGSGILIPRGNLSV